MPGFWDRLRGGRAASAGDPLAGRFASYPPNRPRHPGDPQTLSDAQRDENLAQLLEERDARLEIVLQMLAKEAVDARPMLDPAQDGAPAAAAVDRWLDAVVPARPMTPLGDPQPNADLKRFHASDGSGADIFWSVLADLALLEGEAIRRRDARFGWAVNREPAFRDMSSYGRIVLLKPGAADWAPTVLELDELLLMLCHAKARPGGNISGHAYGELLAGAVRRAFDPGFRA